MSGSPPSSGSHGEFPPSSGSHGESSTCTSGPSSGNNTEHTSHKNLPEDQMHPSPHDPENLCIQWSVGEGSMKFELLLYHEKVQKYNFQIMCRPDDFYKLKFMFENESTCSDLKKIFLELGYEYFVFEQRKCLNLGSKNAADPEIIKIEIEGAINNMKGVHHIHVYFAESTFCDDQLVTRCKEFSKECERGNIKVYMDTAKICLVGRNEEELKNLRRTLMKKNFINREQEHDLPSSKGANFKVGSWTDPHSGSMMKKEKFKETGADFLSASRHCAGGSHFAGTYSNNLLEGPGINEMTATISAKGARSKKGTDCMVKSTYVQFTSSKSEEKYTYEQSVSYFDYRKWYFLLKNKVQHEKLFRKMREVNALINCYTDGNRGYIEIIINHTAESKVGEAKFKEWIKECDRIMADSFADLIFLTVGCRAEYTKSVQEFLSRKELVTSETIVMFLPSSSHGICLLGGGESMIAMLQKINESECGRGTHFWETGTNQEITVAIIKLDDNEGRLWDFLKGENSVKEQFPTIRMYAHLHGKPIKLIGNKDDVLQGQGFIREHKWICRSCDKEEIQFDGQVLKFLSCGAVQNFLDNEIKKKIDGTWIIVAERSSVLFYGSSAENVKEMVENFKESFHNQKIQVAMKRELSNELEKWRKRATRIEENTKGKFCMIALPSSVSMVSDASLELTFLFTNDLLENKDIFNLVDEIETASATKIMVNITPATKFYIQKVRKEDLLEVAQSQNVKVDFGENTLGLKGDEAGTSFVKKYIEKLNCVRKSILLPESLVLCKTPENLCGKYHCALDIMPQNQESRVWSMHKKAVIVFLGEPVDDFYGYSRAVLNIGKDSQNKQGSPSVSFRHQNTRILTINIPEFKEGKAMHCIHESFGETYKMMLQFKLRSLWIPMNKIGSWTVKRFVKGLLYPLIQLDAKEVITVILSDTDPSRCKQANNALKDAGKQESEQSIRIELLVKKGEIAKEKVDVIVNTVSQDLDLSHGAVSKSILEAAKPEIQSELNKKKSHKASAKYGEMYETGPHGLGCQKVFHGALMKWVTHEEEPRKRMQSFIRKCLEKAHEYQYSSLAFPALGTGNLSFPSKVVAEIAKETIEEFEGAHETTTIKTIAFIIYVKDEDTFKVFQDILETKKINEKRESIELTGETLQWLCVYGDKDDVTRTMNELNEYFQAGILKVQKSSLKEPEVQEMIDRGSDVQAELNPNKSVSMMAESDDTKCCLIAKFSDRSLLYESPSLKNITLKTLICPYKKEYEALLIFNSCKDAEQALTSCKECQENLELRTLEKQAVCNVQAQVSYKFLKNFVNLDNVKDRIIKSSGVNIRVSEEKKWILTGSLPQIELAHTCLRDSYLSLKESNYLGKKAEVPKSVHAKDLTSLQTSVKSSSFASKVNKKNGKTCSEDQTEHRGIAMQESTAIQITEDDYQKFMAVYQFTEGKREGSITYNNSCMQVSGSKSFIQKVTREKDEILTEMTVKKIQITEDVYKMMKSECQSFVQSNPLVFSLFNDREKEIELFGMSQQAVDDAERSVTEKQKKIMEDRKRTVKSNAPNVEEITFTTNEGLTVKVYKGDITKLNVQCVVNSANANLDNKRGISQVIAEAGGQELTRACYNYIREKKRLSEGCCCSTTAGDLNYKHVIHACVPYWGNAGEYGGAANVLKTVVFNALVLSEDLKVQSVGIPALCSAQAHANKQKCAEMYVGAVIEFSASKRLMHLQEVHFSDRNRDIVGLIADTFEQKLKSLAVPPRPCFFPSFKEIKVPKQPIKTECILKSHFKVVIYHGSIVESDVEAVSCGQDPKLQSKGRIAQDIVKKCKNLKDDLRTLSKKETGETILMNCNLKYAKRVIFVITESPSSADQYIFQSIQKCYRNVLDIADNNGIKKLALPLIGTGNKGAPINQIARIWFDSILKFLESTSSKSSLREVHFVSKDPERTSTISSLFTSHIEKLRRSETAESFM